MTIATILPHRVVSAEEMAAWPIDRTDAPADTWTNLAWRGDQHFHWNIWPNRVVFTVEGVGEVARAEAVWRRSARSIRLRGLKLVCAATGEEIRDAALVRYDQERVVVDFRPVGGPGRYDLYFAAACPVRFDPSAAWLAQRESAEPLPAAPQVIEARCRLDSFAPMEIIALPAEVEALKSAHPDAPYLVFPEDRDRSIKLTRELPAHWADGPSAEVALRADRNEYRVFQLGLWACRAGFDDVSVECTDLRGPSGAVIPAGRFQCLTLESRIRSACIAKPRRPFPVPAGAVRALWCGLDLPDDLPPGEYLGTLTVRPANLPAQHIPLRLTVTGHVAQDHGDHDLWRLSRLRWLESDIGLTDEVYPPYAPLQVDVLAIRTWGHALRLGADGMPEGLAIGEREVLAAPIVLAAGGQTPAEGTCRIVDATGGHVRWEAVSTLGDARLTVGGLIEYDGCAVITLRLDADGACRLTDLALELRWRPECAWLAAGMGYRGGKREGNRAWRSLPRGAQGYDPMLWMGGLDAGLGFATWERTPWEDPARPDAALITGGDDAVTLRLNLGDHEIAPDTPWEMTFALRPTPVKPPDARHWDFRYLHLGGGFSPGEYDTPQSFLEDGCKRLDETVAMGVKRLNLHDWWGPAFNYPWQWDGPDNLSRLSAEAHARGIHVKVYNSGRELSTNAPEFWGLVYEGAGYDFSADRDDLKMRLHAADAWFENHLPDGLPRGWPRVHAAGNEHAVPVSNATRIGNFYLESMRYMAEHFGADGAYWDGADGPTLGHREMAKRLWTIYRQTNPAATIDVHHGTTLLESAIVQHMLVLPFIDSIWHGEGFPYDTFDPWQWLVEIAGIPFGIPSELLGGEEHFCRAMTFGIWPRMGWCAGTDKQEKLWRFFDQFNIQGATMRGWWEDNGITVDRPEIKVTAFCHPQRGVLLAIGSWHPEVAAWMEMTLDVSLLLDREKIGLPAGTLLGTDILTGEDVDVARPVLLPEYKSGRLVWVRC